MDAEAQEHIKWMEEHEASVQNTAEHFGITRQQFHRELLMVNYQIKDWFRWDDDPPKSWRYYRPFLY